MAAAFQSPEPSVFTQNLPKLLECVVWRDAEQSNSSCGFLCSFSVCLSAVVDRAAGSSLFEDQILVSQKEEPKARF